MAVPKNYEAGMRISFDAKTKNVSVAFRGKLTILPGPFPAEKEAIRAGEDFCRKHGWSAPLPPDDRAGQSLLKHRKLPPF
jgi:hypothetical protein